MAVIETLDYALNYDEIISQYQIILSCFFPKSNKKMISRFTATSDTITPLVVTSEPETVVRGN